MVHFLQFQLWYSISNGSGCFPTASLADLYLCSFPPTNVSSPDIAGSQLLQSGCMLGLNQALSASVTEDELSADNTAVALVGKGTPFTILEGDALKPYLAALKADDDAPPPGAAQLPPVRIRLRREGNQIGRFSGSAAPNGVAKDPPKMKTGSSQPLVALSEPNLLYSL